MVELETVHNPLYMIDIFPTISSWAETKKSFAIATVIKTWGSAPRMVGSSLAVSEHGEMAGSVSGGCVEGNVVKAALEVIASGQTQRLSYGVADEEAWEVGLSCGGELHVFLEKALPSIPEFSALWDALSSAVHTKRGCVLLSKMGQEHHDFGLVYADGAAEGELEDALITLATTAYAQRKSQIIAYQEASWFAHVFPGPSTLLIIGATHLTADLVSFAHSFGFETHVIDPRGFFAKNTQFAEHPTNLYEQWPADVLENIPLDAYTYAVLLTHDPKIDDQALHILLPSKVGYIGALGGRKTQQKRRNRMAEAGYAEEIINRIHGPVGVNINAKRPKEIALSIMAEIIQVQNAYL